METFLKTPSRPLPSIVVEMCRVCFEFHRHSSHGTIKYVFIRMHKNRASCLHTMFRKKETLPKNPVQNYWHLLLGSNQGITLSSTVHRGVFCQFPFRWIYYYGSNESTGKETGKTHLCALMYLLEIKHFVTK